MKYLLFLILIGCLSSCYSSSICSKPTNREIRKAMSYSTWKYSMPLETQYKRLKK